MKNRFDVKNFIRMGICVLCLASSCESLWDSESPPPEDISVRVSYDGNGHTGGSAPEDSAKYSSGQTVKVLGNTGSLTRTDYVFSRWNTASDGSGTDYTPGETFKIGSANVVLYAVWQIKSYIITFKANGGNGADYTQAIVPNTSENLVPCKFTRTGYDFSGWATSATGSRLYADGSNYTMGKVNVTLYALWTPLNGVSATVSIPGDGAITISPSTITVVKGDTLSVSVVQKTYSFYQWYLDGTELEDSSDTINIDTAELTAGVHWLLIVVTDSAGVSSSEYLYFTVEN